jgi:hypothetical protein
MYDDLSDLKDRPLQTEISLILSTTLERLAPFGSQYHKVSDTLAAKIGALKALKREYETGYLVKIQALVRAEVFSDFLEMAEHLITQGYKDPSAVLVGGTLEEHLRELCKSRSIPIQISEKPKKADLMNSELAAAKAYNILDQKNITAWLDLRNKAAHGKYSEYTIEQVTLMLTGVKNFFARIAP